MPARAGWPLSRSCCVAAPALARLRALPHTPPILLCASRPPHLVLPPPELGLDGESRCERGNEEGENFCIELRVLWSFTIALNVSPIYF